MKIKDERAWLLWSEASHRLEKYSASCAACMLNVNDVYAIEYQDGSFDMFVDVSKEFHAKRIEDNKLILGEILYGITGRVFRLNFVFAKP